MAGVNECRRVALGAQRVYGHAFTERGAPSLATP